MVRVQLGYGGVLLRGAVLGAGTIEVMLVCIDVRTALLLGTHVSGVSVENFDPQLVIMGFV